MHMIRTRVVHQGRLIGFLSRTLWGYTALWSPSGDLLGMKRHASSAEEALLAIMEGHHASTTHYEP